ncbi:putative quinol monooxygenase [Bradyrhizobium yuanmingense]|uniref:putative quinol monooxygenase n=1 Tax=Bradyrhizobium yuanmingense TaxID=108015 RepID=UPI003D2ECABB
MRPWQYGNRRSCARHSRGGGGCRRPSWSPGDPITCRGLHHANSRPQLACRPADRLYGVSDASGRGSGSAARALSGDPGGCIFRGGPGARQAWKRRHAARRHLAADRPGPRRSKNLVYFLQEDRAKPGHFIFYEVFASQADFDAHNAMPYVRDWFAKLPELADGGVEVMRMAILGKPKK